MLDREPADIKSNGMSLVELCCEGHVRVASHQLLQKLEEKSSWRLSECICVLSLRADVLQLD